MFFTLLSLVSLVAAQAPNASSTVGGAIPAGVPQPNTAGFTNPTVSPGRGGSAICVSGTVSVTVTAQNIVLNLQSPANQTDLTQTFLSSIADGSPFTQQLITGTQNVSGTYDIGASLCMSANGSESDTVQFLTHGVGFDRYYWDWAPGYSYVDYAATRGHTTFIYDRLGTGQSSHPDPIKTVQAPLEVEIAATLIQLLRDGAFGGTNFTSVVGVGHSYGSIMTQGVTSRHPTLLSAAVLTGFSTNGTGQPPFMTGNNYAIAAQNSPFRFTGLDPGYIVSASATSNQIAFFRAPNFDPATLALVDAEKSTLTMGELFTTSTVIRPSTEFANPVAFVNGDSDLPFCDANCTYPVNKATLTRSQLYPRARNLTLPTSAVAGGDGVSDGVSDGGNVFIVPQTGHGINLHYSANTAYQYIQDFIEASGF